MQQVNYSLLTGIDQGVVTLIGQSCGTICDRDQNEIKRSRGYLVKSSDQGGFQIANQEAYRSDLKLTKHLYGFFD